MTVKIRTVDPAKGDATQVLELAEARQEIESALQKGHLVTDSYDRPVVNAENVADGETYRAHKLVAGG